MHSWSNPGKNQNETQQYQSDAGFRGSLLSSEGMVRCPSNQPAMKMRSHKHSKRTIY